MLPYRTSLPLAAVLAFHDPFAGLGYASLAKEIAMAPKRFKAVR
jgi:hypothetical protein